MQKCWTPLYPLVKCIWESCYPKLCGGVANAKYMLISAHAFTKAFTQLFILLVFEFLIYWLETKLCFILSSWMKYFLQHKFTWQPQHNVTSQMHLLVQNTFWKLIKEAIGQFSKYGFTKYWEKLDLTWQFCLHLPIN